MNITTVDQTSLRSAVNAPAIRSNGPIRSTFQNNGAHAANCSEVCNPLASVSVTFMLKNAGQN